MKVMAQVGMVMNLDKCIGCHTCSVTCKQAWTNRAGVEYAWFNNVETRPGQGYPRTYQDQEVAGRLGPQAREAAAARRFPVLQADQDLLQPGAPGDERLLRAVDLRVRHPDLRAPGRAHAGGAAQVADHGQADADPLVGQLGRRPRRRPGAGPQGPDRDQDPRPGRRPGEDGVRAGVHVLPAAHLRALPEPGVRGLLPERGDVQAHRGRHRPGRPGRVSRLADVRHGLPVQEGLLQPPHGQGREVHDVLPAHRGRPADGVLGDVRGSAALPRAVPLRRRPGHGSGCHPRREGPLRGAARPPARPERPRGARRRPARRHPGRLDRGGAPVPGLQAGQGVPGRAPAAPGVPHHAHGLVHPAAVAGRRRAARDGPRRGGCRHPVRGAVEPADPDRVPRRAVHRRRSGSGPRARWPPWLRCAPTCATATSAARATPRSRRRSD